MVDYGQEVPCFPIDWEKMWTTGFTAFAEECRYKKGAMKYPFFKIDLPNEFVKLFDLKKRQLPPDLNVSISSIKFESNRGGVYYMTGKESTGLMKSLKNHLDKMKDTVVEDWRTYYDRRKLRSLKSFEYMENMEFSLMQEIYSDTALSLPPGWNLNQLIELKSVLLNDIPGVTKSMSYAGEEFTYAPAHIEDVGLGSVNFVFPDSASKVWMGFAKEQYGAVKAATKRNFSATCPDILLHKCIMYDVDFYNANKIPYYYAIQGSGQIIVTNPNGFHGVVNTGRNFSEATNFYCMGSIHESLAYPLCDCNDVVKQYQCDEWQSYINYCQNVEKCMLYSAAQITGEEEEPVVDMYRQKPPTTSTVDPPVQEESVDIFGSRQDTETFEESTVTSNGQPHDDDFEKESNASIDFVTAPPEEQPTAPPEEQPTAAPDEQSTAQHDAASQQSPSGNALVETVPNDEDQEEFVRDIDDPLVQSVMRMLQPSVYFAPQTTPPPTMEPVESTDENPAATETESTAPRTAPTPPSPPSPATRRANMEQGSRFRALKQKIRTDNVPLASQNTINNQLNGKRERMQGQKRKYEGATESRRKAHQKHEAKRKGKRSDRRTGIIADSFRKDLQELKRDRDRIGNYIQNHYSRVRIASADELQAYITARNDNERNTAQLLRSRDEEKCVLREFRLKTAENYDQITGRNDCVGLEKHGIKNYCTFNRLQHFHVVEASCVDIMHDLFEGHLKKLLVYVVKSIIEDTNNERKITLEDINNAVTSFPYTGRLAKNKPQKFFADHIKKGEIAMSSAKTIMNTTLYLPLILYQGKIPIHPDNKWYRLFLGFLDVLDLLLAPKILKEQLPGLQISIQTYLMKYINLGGHMTVKPHLTIHYPDTIKRFGALTTCWSMPFETKHKAFKAYERNNNNHKDLAMTLTQRLQEQNVPLYEEMAKEDYLLKRREKKIKDYFKVGEVCAYDVDFEEQRPDSTAQRKRFAKLGIVADIFVDRQRIKLKILKNIKYSFTVHAYEVQSTEELVECDIASLKVHKSFPKYGKFVRLPYAV